MRHDPLLVPIYFERQSLGHLGAYVIRKMTPSKHRYPEGSYNFVLSFFFFFFFGMFWFWDLFGVLHKMLNDRREWLWHTNIGALFSVWASMKTYSFQAFRLVSVDLPHWPLSHPCMWKSKQKPSFTKPPSQMVLIYSQGKTLSHLWLVLGMASSFTNQASSFSESLHVLAVGRFYGYCLGNQCHRPNKIAFSGLGMVRPFFKVFSSSNGHQPQVSRHLLASLVELLSSRHWIPFLEMVQDTQPVLN